MFYVTRTLAHLRPAVLAPHQPYHRKRSRYADPVNSSPPMTRADTSLLWPGTLLGPAWATDPGGRPVFALWRREQAGKGDTAALGSAALPPLQQAQVVAVGVLELRQPPAPDLIQGRAAEGHTERGERCMQTVHVPHP